MDEMLRIFAFPTLSAAIVAAVTWWIRERPKDDRDDEKHEDDRRKALHEEIERLWKRLDDRDRVIEAMRVEITTMRQNYDAAMASQKEQHTQTITEMREQHRQAVAKFTDELTATGLERDSLKRKLDAATARITELETRVAQLSAASHSL